MVRNLRVVSQHGTRTYIDYEIRDGSLVTSPWRRRYATIAPPATVFKVLSDANAAFSEQSAEEFTQQLYAEIAADCDRWGSN